MNVANTRDELVAAGCSYAASRFHLDLHPEVSTADAELELHEEMLEEAAKNYLAALAEVRTR